MSDVWHIRIRGFPSSSNMDGGVVSLKYGDVGLLGILEYDLSVSFKYDNMGMSDVEYEGCCFVRIRAIALSGVCGAFNSNIKL